MKRSPKIIFYMFILGCGCVSNSSVDHLNVIYDTLIDAQSRLPFCNDRKSSGKVKCLDCIKLIGSTTLGKSDTSIFSIYSFDRLCPQFCSGAYVAEISQRNSIPRIIDVTSMPATTSLEILNEDTGSLVITEAVLVEARREWWKVMDCMANSNLELNAQVGLFASLSRLSGLRVWSMRSSRQITSSDSLFIAIRIMNSPKLNVNYYYIDSLEKCLMKAVQKKTGLEKYWLLPDSTILYYDTAESMKSISPVYLFPEKVHNFVF